MAHHAAARIAAGAPLTVILGLISAPAAQAAPAAAPQGINSSAGPLSLDNLLSLGFLAPTVRDAKRQATGLVSGLSPTPTDASGLSGLLK
ncbi:hypothetical protein [Streptomyces sp. NPDC002467]|uniref:hypothetical protein n=1 Tax=Streptomyces sp. NPDC002467 TaxID=3364647 RepID=UPI0036844271